MWLADLLWSLVGWLFVPTTISPQNAVPSANGLAFLKQHEGWRDRLYRDSNGNATIGYGHLVVPGDGFNSDTRLTYAQGESILANDAATAARAVRTALARPVTQNQFDAMLSLAFNIGGSNFARSEVLRQFNAGNIPAASLAFVQNWTTAGGNPTALLSRRQDERALFDRH